MSTLLGYLSAFTATRQPRIHTYGPNTQSTLTFKAVSKQAQALRQQFAEARGTRVAVTLTASAESLLTLVALDGFVAELIVLAVDKPVPAGCHFHLTERGHWRKLNDFTVDNLPVVTQWGLLDEQDELVTYSLDELAGNALLEANPDESLRWGVMQEPAELAGLLVWLRALKQGDDLVLAQADTLITLAELFAHAEVSAIAAPPRLWRNLMVAAETARLELKLAVLNGGLVDGATLRQIQAMFFDAQVLHSFSCTAAGKSWLIEDGEAGLPAALFTNDESSVVLALEHNQLDVVFTGNGARIHTGFLARHGADGRVHLLGSEAVKVQVGGRDVYPEQVEATLLEVDGVCDVQASSMPDPVLGELIRVDVLAPQHRTVAARKDFKKTLQAYCRDHLQPWQRPVRYYFH